jgi:hypothetical protein
VTILWAAQPQKARSRQVRVAAKSGAGFAAREKWDSTLKPAMHTAVPPFHRGRPTKQTNASPRGRE